MKPFYYISIVIVVTSFACGLAVPVSMPVNTNKPVAVNTGDITAKAVSQMVVCRTDPNHGLRVRTDAGTQYPEVDVLPNGTPVTLGDGVKTPVVTDWYEIKSPVSGWVNSNFLCLNRRVALIASNKARFWTDEARERISIANKNRPRKAKSEAK